MRIYPTYLKILSLRRAKVPGTRDDLSVHISNVDQFVVVGSKELSRLSSAKLSNTWGVLLFVVLTSPLLGASYTWQGGNPAAGPFPWGTAANWTPAGPPDANVDTAIFPTGILAARRIVQVNDTFIVNRLDFNSVTSYTLNPLNIGNGLILDSTGGTAFINVSAGSTGPHYINVPATLINSNLAMGISPSTSIVFSQPILEGTVGTNISLGGGGTATFTAENGNTGATSVGYGTFLLVGDGALSPLCPLSLIPSGVGAAGVFDMSGINGTTRTIANLSGVPGVGTTISLILGNKNLTFGNSNSTTFTGSITGEGGSLTKKGSGTFTLDLTGGATYSGPTIIDEGTFASNDLNSLSPNSDFFLDDSSILDLNGFDNTIRSLSGNTINSTVTGAAFSHRLIITNGGNYHGNITGGVGLTIGGTLNLYRTNTHTGITVVNNGAVVGIGANDALGSRTIVFNPTSTLQALATVSLSNTIALADNNNTNIDLQNYTMTLSGNLTNSSSKPSSLIVTGGAGSNLILSGTGFYKGSTTLGSGVTVTAGSTTGLSSDSNFILEGSSTLDLQTFSNTIKGLSGSSGSIVNIGAGATLNVGETGGDFEGTIQGAGGIQVEGPLTLSGINTFTGATFIGTSSTENIILSLVGDGALAPTAPVTLIASLQNTTFDISGINGPSRTIGPISGTAGVGDVTIILGDKNLTFGVGSPNTFAGIFTGLKGSLTKQGAGTVTVSASGSNYWGPTTLNQGSFRAGIANAFSPNSPFILYDGTTLNLNGFSNTIQGLTSSNTTISTSNVTNSAGGTPVLTLTSGGNFAGTITGSLLINLTGGTLNLYNPGNTYSGATLTSAGTVLGIGNNDVFGTDSTFLDSATLRSLGNFSLSNTITILGSSTFDLQSYATTFSGIVNGIGSLTIISSPSGTLTLSGLSVYGAMTGSTTLTEGVTLKAGSTTGFSPNSNFVLLGTSTLDLNGFDNTVYSLSAPIPPPNKGLVTNSGSANATLTITNGGVYGGKITDGILATTAINLTDGTLIFGFPNTYSGTTTLNNTSTLQAVTANAFSPNSLVSLNDTSTLDLNSKNNTIAGLEGTANTTVILGNNATLTIGGGLTATFQGAITNAPCGSLAISGGSNQTLTGASTFCGTTNVINGTLNIQGDGSLSPNSAVQVQPLGNLTVGAFANPIPSLTTSGTVVNTGGDIRVTSAGNFTMTGGTFTNTTDARLRFVQGLISGGQFININDSRVINSSPGATLSITGGVVSNGTTCSTVACTTTSAGCNGNDGSFLDIDNLSFTGGIINANSDIFAVDSYTQGPNATLNLILCDPTYGNIQGNGPILLDGTLVVTAGPLFPVSPTGFYPLVSKFAADVGVPTHVGEFSSIQFQGFAPNVHPRVITSPPRLGTGGAASVVTLYFSGCDATWDDATGGNWNDDTNWNPPCVPGITTPLVAPIVTNDAARFIDLSASSIAVTLAYESVLSPPTISAASPVLYTLQFNAPTTSYTINPFAASKLTFDAVSTLMPPAQLLVDAGSHIINAPIVLNVMTDLSLADGAQLTLGTTGTVHSGASTTTELYIFQSSLSTLGTGTLVNNSTIAPYSFHFGSATVQNNAIGFISPTGPLTIDPLAGQTAHLINAGTINPVGNLVIQGSGTTLIDNSGSKAKISSSTTGSTISLSGPGPMTVNNSGSAAIFGNSSADGDLSISSAGPVTLNNTGGAALMGPSGTGGQFIVNGTGTLVFNNTGSSAIMGATGAGGAVILNSPTATFLNQGVATVFGATGLGGNLTINAGTIQNNGGAIVKAGSGGLFTIAGGTVNNDLSSQLGTLTQNMLLTGGTITSSGAMYAFDYTQQSGANLTLNLTSARVFGFVQAAGVITIDNGQLNVKALPGFSAQSNDALVLFEGDQRTGTFSLVNFLDFPDTLIPTLEYFPTTIELLFSGTIGPGGGGSSGGGAASPGTSTNMALSSVNDFNFFINKEIMIMHEGMYKKRKRAHPNDDVCFREEEGSLVAASSVVQTKQEQLTDEKLSSRASRVFLGPIGSVGELRGKEGQAGFDYTSSGVLAGIDRMGEVFGLGLALDYTSASADVHHQNGHFSVDQLHASGYGLWMPSSKPELSVAVILGGGVDWYDFNRPTGSSRLPVTAVSKPNGQEVDALVNVQYIFAKEKYAGMPESISFVPMVNLQYVRITLEKFREHQAGSFDLEVSSQVRKSLRSYMGARLIHMVSSKVCDLRTEFDLGWQREYLDDDYTLALATVNLPQVKHIQVPFYGLNNNSFLGGIDLLLTVYDKFQVEASYDLQWNPRFISNSFYFGIGGKF